MSEQNNDRAISRRSALGMLGLGVVGGAGAVSTMIGGRNQRYIPNSIEYAFSDRVQWTYDVKTTVGGLAIEDGTVYAGSDRLHAVDADTGNKQWTYQTEYGTEEAPVVANEMVYFVSDHSLYAADAATGELQWTFDTGEGIRASPAVKNGTAYVSSFNGNLYAVDAASGEQRWQFDIGGSGDSTPVVWRGLVFVGSSDNGLYAITADGGRQRWKFEATDTVNTPVVTNNLVLAGCADGNLYAVEAESGLLRWDFNTDGRIHSQPAVKDKSVFFGTFQDRAYAVNIEDGEQQWSFDGVGNAFGPEVFDDRVYFGSLRPALSSSEPRRLVGLSTESGGEQWSFPISVNGTPVGRGETLYVCTGGIFALSV